MSKRDIAHPKRVVKAQDAGAIGYLVETFGAHETGDDWGTGVVELVPNLARGEGGGEIGREAGVQAVHEVDLLESLAHAREVDRGGVVALGFGVVGEHILGARWVVR